MKPTFCYMVMTAGSDPARNRARIESEDLVFETVMVPDMEAAKQEANAMLERGVGVLELCGAFGEAKAREIIEATGGKLPVSYLVTPPDQAEATGAFFRSAHAHRH